MIDDLEWQEQNLCDRCLELAKDGCDLDDLCDRCQEKFREACDDE
jgi:hypothetical protein